MTVHCLGALCPRIDASAYIAPTASVIGNVTIGPESSVWFGTVIRADSQDEVRIGARSNVQDGSVLHLDPGKPLTVGDGVTIGHMAMLHGCTIGDGSLIGIGAIVLNGARIGCNCLVGAGALVTENKTFEDGSLIIGRPARAVRMLDDEAIESLRRNAQVYVDRARRFRDELQSGGGVRPLCR